jgi:uncharacterized protein (TIGR03437 family)
VDAPVYLSFYGTGIRGAGRDVMVEIADTPVRSTYAGPQGIIPGLDQVNVSVPLLLRGSGVVNVSMIVGGVKSNPVKIAIR